MLTGRLVNVRVTRQRVIPRYIDAADAGWREVAERLLEVFRAQAGRMRGELDEEVRAVSGSDPAQLVHQGLAKLLEDRCEYEVVSGHPPDQLRAAMFAAAATARQGVHSTAGGEHPLADRSPFDRLAVIARVAGQLGLSLEAAEQSLFADLKSEQRLIRFKDTSGERLLERYNLALAQAVLLRSTRVHVLIRGESPQRYRQLFRAVKFHRLVCEIARAEPDGYLLHLDGPLSLFSATQKYGLQLALFLPAVVLCKDFEIRAEIRWGPRRTEREFLLTPAEGLVSHYVDTGMYVPPELGMFAELFRKRIRDWEISPEVEVLPLGDGFWIPDFLLRHKESGQHVHLEVLGFWRRSSLERHLKRLRKHAPTPFLLAISDQLHVEDTELEGLPASVHRFRQMPLPDEIARLARELTKPAGESASLRGERS